MTTKDHLMAAGCDQATADAHASLLEGLDPAVLSQFLAVLREVGIKALPALLAALPLIQAGDWAGALVAVIRSLIPAS